MPKLHLVFIEEKSTGKWLSKNGVDFTDSEHNAKTFKNFEVAKQDPFFDERLHEAISHLIQIGI